MEKIPVDQLNGNVFSTIGKEWMLITAGNKDAFNMMTASWGCVGWLWNKPVAVVFVRPERYTHGFVEEHECLTVSFLGHSDEARKIYNVCGSKSGRDMNKAEAAGLKPVLTELGNVTYEQARLTLECRKLYKDDIKASSFIEKGIERWYGGAAGGFHDMYILEIVNAYKG